MAQDFPELLDLLSSTVEAQADDIHELRKTLEFMCTQIVAAKQQVVF